MELSRIQALWSKRVTNKFEGFLEKPASVGFLDIFGSTGRLVTLRFNRNFRMYKEIVHTIEQIWELFKNLGRRA